ncbi:hypothetical protein [Streptomyces sp. NPDC059009]|uniref:hypothetical protein n=1 Tax=Streptomyces sp. NPDC059009 TaxID=3346694 RepID=UPI0036C73941
MTNRQEVAEPSYAVMFTELRQAFADLGIHPQAMTYDAEAVDANGERVVLLGWLTARQAEVFTESVKQLRKAAGL